ncbi:MAG: Lrp/AsnC family transcriptional regulator [Pseudomonadota bacterium]
MSEKNETVPLTDMDRAVLRLIQADANATLDDIAASAGLSTASAWRRIKALEKAGVIDKRVTILSPDAAGWPLCAFADVSLKDHSAGNRRSFERFVTTAEEVMECHSLAGARDYLLKIRAPDIAAYEAFLMERLLAHPAVASASSSFSLRELKFTTALPV